ncbi:MAG: hypothetical protein AAF514_20705 [Verrucomicrobiota bacterium]
MNDSDADHASREIRAALTRMVVLIEASQFKDDADRKALLTQVDSMSRELGRSSDLESLLGISTSVSQVESLTASLFAVSDPPEKKCRILREISDMVRAGIEAWEAQHPKLASMMMGFVDILAKAGV